MSQEQNNTPSSPQEYIAFLTKDDPMPDGSSLVAYFTQTIANDIEKLDMIYDLTSYNLSGHLALLGGGSSPFSQSVDISVQFRMALPPLKSIEQTTMAYKRMQATHAKNLRLPSTGMMIDLIHRSDEIAKFVAMLLHCHKTVWPQYKKALERAKLSHQQTFFPQTHPSAALR
jgi:hypothetical protein